MKQKKEYSNNIKNIIAKNINNFIKINTKYKSKGFDFYLKNNFIEIIYNNSSYFLSITKEKENYYWDLNFTNKLNFKVKIDNTIESIEIIIKYIYNIKKNEKTKKEN